MQCIQERSRALVAGEISKSVQKQNSPRRRGRELERGEEKELDGLEEGEGRGKKLLAKRTTYAFAGSRDKKGQGGLLTRRDRTRTRMTVCGEREAEREREG